MPSSSFINSTDPSIPASGPSSAAHLHPTGTTRASRSSSICSTATSVDAIEDINRINKFRPMYDSSSSLENQLGSVSLESQQRAENADPNAVEGGKGEGKESTVTSRRFPEEEEEDILKETNDRFVLFPIKYREVSYTNRCRACQKLTFVRYGMRTKLPKRVSGRQRSWIWGMIWLIGTKS